MAIKSALINVMFNAAEKASRRMMRDFGEVENLQVSRKGAADFVSQADLNAEEILREELSKARPGWNFLMEEGGQVIEDKDAPTWIIDPIDGTTNFLHGIPHFAISVAVRQNNKLTAGIVFDPCRNELFHADQGSGAYVNGRRLRVSGRRHMSDSLFATGIPFLGRGTEETDAKFQAELNSVAKASAGVRRFGSAALDLAWVAAGRYDGFWERGLSPWDIAAGIVLVRESGGFVSDFAARDKAYESGDVVAANAALHVPLLKALRNA